MRRLHGRSRFFTNPACGTAHYSHGVPAATPGQGHSGLLPNPSSPRREASLFDLACESNGFAGLSFLAGGPRGTCRGTFWRPLRHFNGLGDSGPDRPATWRPSRSPGRPSRRRLHGGGAARRPSPWAVRVPVMCIAPRSQGGAAGSYPREMTGYPAMGCPGRVAMLLPTAAETGTGRSCGRHSEFGGPSSCRRPGRVQRRP